MQKSIGFSKALVIKVNRLGGELFRKLDEVISKGIVADTLRREWLLTISLRRNMKIALSELRFVH